MMYRVGDTVLNMDNVAHIRLEAEEVTVTFVGPGPEGYHRLELRGEEARALRAWAERQYRLEAEGAA